MATKVYFHLPGLRQNFVLNMIFVKLMRDYPNFFMSNVEIGSFYGEFPCSRWNGGRVSVADQCDANYIRHVIDDVNSAGIPIRYTYTNPLLTEADLDDEYCNFCMQAADNGMNEVLVVSPILEEYIRKKYPRFKINSSTCKEIRNIDDVNTELKKDYNLVVLDYNFNNDFKILEKIASRAKCEILVNACCEPNCKRRGEHYRFLAKQQMQALDNRKLPEEERVPIQEWKCKWEHLPTIYSICGYKTFVSHKDLWNKYVSMGFCNFKIEGRITDMLNVMDTYCYYMAKPECRDAVRMMCLIQMENMKLITLAKPRRMEWHPGD